MGQKPVQLFPLTGIGSGEFALVQEAQAKKFGGSSFRSSSRSKSSWSRPAPSFRSGPSSSGGYKAPKAAAPKAAPSAAKPPASGKVTAPKAPAAPAAVAAPKAAAPAGTGPTATGVRAPKAPGSSAAGAGSAAGQVRTPGAGALNLGSVPLGKAERAQARAASLKAAQARQATVTATRNSDAYKAATGGKTYKPSDVKAARRAFQNRYRPKYEREYEFHSHNYGGMGGAFLGTMLLGTGVAMAMNQDESHLWYALSESDETRQFLADARAEALANGDTELVQRIDQVEAEIARLKAEGAPRETVAQALKALDIPPEAAFADDVLTGGAAPAMVMSTGGTGGIYEALCAGRPDAGFSGLKKTAEAYGISVECMASEGGDSNLRRYTEGLTQVFPAQADNLYAYQQQGVDFGANQYVLYQEPFLFLTAKNSDIDALTDIDETTTIYVVGGAAVSWQELRAFAADDTFLGFGGNQDYAKARVVPAHDWDTALRKTQDDPNAVLFMVMSVEAPRIQSIDRRFGSTLRLVPVDDDRFLSMTDPSGSRIYASCEIPGDALPNLQAGWLFGTDATSTLCTDALLLVDPAWVAGQDPLVREQLGMAVVDMLTELPAVVH